MAALPVLGRIVRLLRPTPTRDALAGLERRLGHHFDRRDLLEEALTHRSYANEKGVVANYERLEFLGDRVLGHLASVGDFRRHTRHPEGKLSTRKSPLGHRPALAPRPPERAVGGPLSQWVG